RQRAPVDAQRRAGEALVNRRKRPSGTGSNSRRFAEITAPDGTKLRVPVAKDVGTFIFLRDEDSAWSDKPTAVLLDSAPELHEGALIEVEEAGAGAGMGTITGARIVQVVVRLS